MYVVCAFAQLGKRAHDVQLYLASEIPSALDSTAAGGSAEWQSDLAFVI